MKLNPFSKPGEDKKTKKKVSPKTEIQSEAKEEVVDEKPSNITVSVRGVLKGFYVSEKASLANADNQYFFLVSKKTNKSEIKKEVSKIYEVKVKSVKILNMPEKRRDLGKHPGVKAGFKKAIVVLRRGYTIGQAKA